MATKIGKSNKLVYKCLDKNNLNADELQKFSIIKLDIFNKVKNTLKK